VIFRLFLYEFKGPGNIYGPRRSKGTIRAEPVFKEYAAYSARAGMASDGGWMSEQRDIYERLRQAFGGKPRGDIGRSPIMTDADSTGSVAEASLTI